MKYKFAVILCGGYAGGTLKVQANDEDEAYEKAMEIVGNKLYEAFPTLSIDYNVEME